MKSKLKMKSKALLTTKISTNVSLVHATCVRMPDSKHAVLILGSSGTGKSDLAIRLIARGAKLVADDQVMLKRRKDKIIATAPLKIKGLLEVRGVGIVKLASAKSATLKLVIKLTQSHKVERLPDVQTHSVLGVSLPKLLLNPFEQSAVDKLFLAYQIVCCKEKLISGFMRKSKEK